MKPHHPARLCTALSLFLAAVAIFSLGGCSTDAVAARQQGVTGIHQSGIDRRETRQQARDERFRASRESWMN